MEKGFLVTRTFRVLAVKGQDFSYSTSVYRDRNEAIKVFTSPSRFYRVERLSKNQWVEFAIDEKVGHVTEISISEINIF